MKNIFYTIVFLLTILTSKAQIIPVEKKIDYRLAGKGIPDGIYFKDVNHLFDKFIGTWKGSINNKNYTFIITTQTYAKYQVTTDYLIIRHFITDLNGMVLSDDRSADRIQITGDLFSKELTFYECFYAGEDAQCGQRGKILIMKVNATTMQLGLRQNEEWFPYDMYCPGGKRAEQILPSTDFVTLIKQ